MALDLFAFIAQFVALRYLAVFVVQAVQAGNLAVTAIAAIPLLGARLAGREWAAVAAVCIGLVLLAVAAGSERVAPVSPAVKWWILVASLAVAVARFRGRPVEGADGAGRARVRRRARASAWSRWQPGSSPISTSSAC